jgi:hypothetical protein
MVLPRGDNRACSWSGREHVYGKLIHLREHHKMQTQAEPPPQVPPSDPRILVIWGCKTKLRLRCGTTHAAQSMPQAINYTVDAIGTMIRQDAKIDDLKLFATLGVLTASWLVAVIGLAFTIKREYLHTFVSLQTGCAYVQSHFLDNEGNDALRVDIFFTNARKWWAIRDLVRQWVLRVHAAWKALMPSWLTEDLQARIPDDFMPVEVVHDLNAQTPDGRRLTVLNLGLLRRVSHAAAVDAASASASDMGQRRETEMLNPS